jgi:integrase
MVKTRFTGVYHRETQAGDKIFYIKGKLHGKSYLSKVGSSAEGVTAAYASKVRNEKHSISRMGEKSPMYKKPQLTLNDGFYKYMVDIEGKGDTRNTKGRYENHIKSIFGNELMEEITTEDIKKFVTAKKKEVSFKTGRVYAPKTINDLVNIISVVYNYNKISPNPAHDVKRDNTNDARERYLNEDEIALLLKMIDEHPKLRKRELVKLFTVLALTTGARLTSVLTITQGDILEDKIRIKDHKNNSTYYAALHPSVTALLPTDLKPTDYVVGGSSKQVHRVSINKMLQPRLNELFNDGLDIEDSKRRVVIHTFRHTFGSLLAIKGVGIYTIKKLMNHSDIKMTMRYAKLSPDIGFDAVKSLNI